MCAAESPSLSSATRRIAGFAVRPGLFRVPGATPVPAESAAPDADEPAFTFGEEAPETEDAAYANERDYFDVAPEEDFLDPDSAPDDFGSLLLDLLREGI